MRYREEKREISGILLAIKPVWANAILDGRKRYEFRRQPPRYAWRNTTVVMYATEPISAIIGEFKIDSVIRKPFEDLWRVVGEYAGVSEGILREYFRGRDVCVAIKIKDPKKYDKPIRLEDIRRLLPSFVPPQNFIYLHRGNPILRLLNIKTPERDERTLEHFFDTG